MEKTEKYCDICGAKEYDLGFRIENRIRHFSVRRRIVFWESVDVCDDCYKEMRNLVEKKKSKLKQMGE